MQALFNAVRAACSATTWSGGVELNRAGAVLFERRSADEVDMRVVTQGGMISYLVTLYPDDAEWACQCNSREEACVHVAGAVIKLRQGGQEGTAATPHAQPVVGVVAYRFERSNGALALQRYIESTSAAVRLESTLSAVATGKVSGPKFVATQNDLEIERMLGTRLHGVLGKTLLPKVLHKLIDNPHVQLDGKNIKVAPPQAPLRIRVFDTAAGFCVQAEPNPDIVEVFQNGAMRLREGLCPLNEIAFADDELARLRRGEVYAASQVQHLVTEVIPNLKKRLPVEIETPKLPRLQRGIEPRLAIQTDNIGGELSVLATLVYGNPPCARVDGEHLIHLGGALPARDMQAEAQLLRRLDLALGLKPGVRAAFAGKAALAFAQALADFDADVSGGAHAQVYLAKPLQPRLQLSDANFELDFLAELPFSDDTSDPTGSAPKTVKLDASAVLAAWQRGDELVPLPGGMLGFAPLPNDWLARFGRQVGDLLAAKSDASELPAASLPDLARLCDALEQPRPTRYTRLAQVFERESQSLQAPALPPDLTASLRSYQLAGVGFMTLMRKAHLGALLADDMGLGKTLQALCVIGPKTLVVAPTSVLHNWRNEISRFRPALACCVYHGKDRQLDESADVILTTYAILRLDIDRLASQKWDCVVLDEAQSIKNPDSQAARAAFRLQADFRLALSGTPVENRLEELWSQMHFANPGLLGGRTHFQDTYVKAIQSGDVAASLALQQKLAPFVLRRIKRDVAPELPPRTDVVLQCELSREERATYDAILAATRQDVVEKLQAGGSVLAALEALLRLRQACCHRALVPGQSAETSSKITLLLETLDQALAEGHKALVFSQWTSLLDLVEPHLHAANIAFLRLDGSTKDRGAVVERFQDDSGPKLLLISLKAGGTGLNLTAADNVFLLDPWWNPAVEDQAADRAHRIGQNRPVLVQRLVASDTVEERILALQESKRSLADAALGGAQQAGAISRDDLLALLA